jgi:hypothetical protein
MFFWGTNTVTCEMTVLVSVHGFTAMTKYLEFSGDISSTPVVMFTVLISYIRNREKDL